MAYIPVQGPELKVPERVYVREVLAGMLITARHFVVNLFGRRDRNPEILDRRGTQVSTVEYPEQKKPYPPGYRGMHRLVPRPDGRPRCVACYLCATACPAQCIYIEAGEYPDDPIEKYPVRFEIDELRCIVCGLCVEACPKDAIRMDTGTHAPSVLSRPLAIFDKEALLAGPAVAHPSDPLTYRPLSLGEAPGASGLRIPAGVRAPALPEKKD